MTEPVVTVSDLAGWLLERLDEDQQVAQAALGNTAHFTYDHSAVPVRDHVTRWTSARVLVEVAAKRAIIDGYLALRAGHPGECKGEGGVVLDSVLDHQLFGPCLQHEQLQRKAPNEHTLRLLALPYAGHDGYRGAEWAP